eukprot:1410123-Rhodomonas_salina.1
MVSAVPPTHAVLSDAFIKRPSVLTLWCVLLADGEHPRPLLVVDFAGLVLLCVPQLVSAAGLLCKLNFATLCSNALVRAFGRR